MSNETFDEDESAAHYPDSSAAYYDDEGARGLVGFDMDDVAPTMGGQFDAQPVYRNIDMLTPTMGDLGGPTLAGDALFDEYAERPVFDDRFTSEFASAAAHAPRVAVTSSFAACVPPPVPPFVRLEHTHFAVAAHAPTGASAVAVLEEITDAFARRGVHWELKESKCKLKCSAYAAHELVAFEVRVYDARERSAASAEEEEPRPHVVEFRRKSGCAFAFGELFVELSRTLACCSVKPIAPLGTLSARAPLPDAGAASAADDAAVLEQLEAHAAALEAFAEAPRGGAAPDQSARAREAARALAAHALRAPWRFTQAPRVWGAVRQVLLRPEGALPEDGAVRLGALAVVAHLAVARCAADEEPSGGAGRVALDGAEADAFAQLIDPLVATLGGDSATSCAPARAEAARAITALARAFPATLKSRGALVALQAACTQRDDLPLQKHAELAMTRLVAAH